METTPLSDLEPVEIETLMLADWAEVINGKLYIQGGGWERRLRANGGSFAIVASILTPWHLTNQQHEISVFIQDADGGSVASPLRGNFTVGRPSKAQPGQRFRSPFVLNSAFSVPREGAYSVELVVNESVHRSVAFYVVDAL